MDAGESTHYMKPCNLLVQHSFIHTTDPYVMMSVSLNKNNVYFSNS